MKGRRHPRKKATSRQVGLGGSSKASEHILIDFNGFTSNSIQFCTLQYSFLEPAKNCKKIILFTDLFKFISSPSD